MIVGEPHNPGLDTNPLSIIRVRRSNARRQAAGGPHRRLDRYGNGRYSPGMSLFERDKSAERLPVSVLTGFLGSGKTTLLNRLLRHPDLADTAVIVNEFGEIGLDHLMVEAVDGETVVMSSGCICCTIRSDLETALRGLLGKVQQGKIAPFRRVVIETTGLADPAPVVQMLMANPLVCHFFRIDAVIATVDALHAPAQLAEHAECRKQAAIADRIVLTKTDLAEPGQVAAAETAIADANHGAPVHRSVSGDIDPARLFDAGWYDPEARGPDVDRWLRDEALRAAAEATEHHHSNRSHDVSRHDDSIASFPLVIDAPLDWQAFSLWLAWLRATHGDKLLRVKGILSLTDTDAPVAIHGVHHVFHSPVELAGWPDTDRRSRIVFITRDLPAAVVLDSWAEFRDAA